MTVGGFLFNRLNLKTFKRLLKIKYILILLFKKSLLKLIKTTLN